MRAALSGTERARLIRGDVLTFTGDPFQIEPEDAMRLQADMVLCLEDGRIAWMRPHAELDAETRARPMVRYADAVICAGFIDAHVHYPQTQMIGAFGEHLLAWLDTYTYPAEQDFADPAHADLVAGLFMRELLRAGTTTAAVYCTVHAHSVDAFFRHSKSFGTRMIAGKVLMDRNAPPALLDTVESGEQDSRDLIRRWHGRGRQLYAVTPRFAGSCSPAQLASAARLWREHPGTYMQTHLSESLAEIAWVKSLFPDRADYLDVYDAAGLTGPRAIFGHGIHVSERELCTCHASGSALAHCPTSNLFLGSGLFRCFDAKRADRPVRVGLGSDLGAGTSFSALATLNEAYKVAQLQDRRLTAAHAFWLATGGGAEALYLDKEVGSVAPGFEADLVVLDLAATPLIAFRQRFCRTLEEKLFVLMTLGDDRAVRATWVAGRDVYDRDRAAPFQPVAAAEP